jgi:endonuclease/exonuclease/phosphatase family metal-dependent hydrolase
MEAPIIKFLHLNVEGRKHIDRITEFLDTREIEVICAQEMYEETAKLLSDKYGYKYIHAPMKMVSGEVEAKGTAILSKLLIKNSEKILINVAASNYRYGFFEFTCTLADIEKEGKVFRFLTVHLPVEYPGENVSPFQLETYEKFKEILKNKGEFMLTGDFNAPRGTIIFDSLAQTYKDNIPVEIISTIDDVLHRSAPLHYVVDGIFTTPGFKVSAIAIHDGLSDHKGITGSLCKNIDILE